MTTLDILLLIGTGIIAGFINVLAGGGSLLTLPVLIFLGVPSPMANATNRLGIFLQNVFAVRGFKSKGVGVFPFSYWVALSACAGSFIGSQIAVEISDDLFRRILAIVMIMVVLLTVFKPKVGRNKSLEDFGSKTNLKSVIIFFFIGIYGGFIQAGIGFLIIAALTLIHNLPMAKVNSIKVFVALCYTAIAITVFIWNEMILWKHGIILAIGTSIGGWFCSRWSVGIPDQYVRGFLLVTVTGLAIKLWFF